MKHINSYEKFLESDYNYAGEEAEYHNRMELEQWQEEEDRKNAISYYESLSDEERMKLQDEFGQEDLADRESKFFKWLMSHSSNPNSPNYKGDIIESKINKDKIKKQ